MKKAAVQVMIITILSKLCGFVREIALSFVYGASAVTDAYLVAQTVPKVLLSLIGTGIVTGFVPMYSRIMAERGREGADRYASNLSNAMIVFCSVVVVFMLLFSRTIVKLFAPGFAEATMDLAGRLVRIGALSVLFTGLSSIFCGYLRLHDDFIIPALIGLPMNIFAISSILISAKSGFYVLGIGIVLSAASQLLLCIPSLRRVNYRHLLTLDLKDKYMKEMALIAIPVIAGTTVNEINSLVDRTMASGIAVGGISALNYANRLNGFVQGLFVMSVTTVFYPLISRMAAEGNMQSLKVLLREAISMVNVILIPAAVGMAMFSEEIITLLFGRGAFATEAIGMTGNALMYYSIGIASFGLKDVLIRVFYAVQDTRTPMVNATISVIINIGLNISLAPVLGIGGLALATSIAGVVSVLLMLFSLWRKIGPFGLTEITKSGAKIGAASAIMAASSWLSLRLFRRFASANFSLVLAICVGAVVYGILISVASIPEVDRTLDSVKRRLGIRANQT